MTSKMYQNRSLEAPVPHHIQIWPRRLPKCLKINPWRPKRPLAPNLAPETAKMLENRSLEAKRPSAPKLALETSKMLQNRSLEAQVPITSKSSPGDLQNTSKSIPGSPNAPSQPNLTLEMSKVLQNHLVYSENDAFWPLSWFYFLHVIGYSITWAWGM